MKRIFCVLLTTLTLLSLWGCSSEEAGKKVSIPENITFTAETLLDSEQLRVTATDITESDPEGCVVTLEMENRTDLSLVAEINSASVDGCMINPGVSESIAPKQIITTQVAFPKANLDGYGITATTQIEMNCYVYDEDTFEEVSINEDFVLYPRGKEVARYQKRKAKDTDVVLMDNDQCKIILTASNPDSFWGYDLSVFVLNKTDKALVFTTQEAFLNQVACDPFWTHTIPAGKCSNTTMYWFENNLKSAGIDKVEEISLMLSVADLSNWQEAVATETVTIKP